MELNINTFFCSGYITRVPIITTLALAEKDINADIIKSINPGMITSVKAKNRSLHDAHK